MSDYARQHDFSTKTGTTIFGSEVDDDFDAALTAINSKIDESREGAASGIATLDAGALLVGGVSGAPTTGGGQIPEASLTLIGGVELATSAEATTGTDALRAITPATLDAVFEQNAGIAGDLKDLGDPAQDTILGWDDSASQAIHFGIGDGLESTAGGVIQLPASLAGNGITLTAGVLALDATVAGAGLAHSAGVLSVNVTDGLDIASDTVGIADVSAGAAQPVVITNGTFTFDLSSITEITGPGLDQAADGFLVSDAGVLKVMPIDQSGIKIVNASDAIQTFAISDANTMQVLDGTTTRVWTIPANAAVAFEIGTVILVQSINTAEIDLKADTGVVLTSQFNTGSTTATTDTVIAGGRGALIKVATDEWTLAGDISD